MSGKSLALGSFIAGLCVGLSFMFLGSHTSINAQISSLGGAAINLAPWVPTVRPIGDIVVTGELRGASQPLDGLHCENCRIAARVITYGGGEYNLQNVRILTERVQLKGAALNTFRFLQSIGVVKAPQPPPPNIKPKQHELRIAPPPGNVTWASGLF
jgi:hypothetical protein